jgi:hypothetical protein
MDQPPYAVDSESRVVVLQALAEVCSHRGWNLLTAHVRSHHVHAVVDAGVPREEVGTGSKVKNQLGGDGRVVEVRDGCGRTRMLAR